MKYGKEFQQILADPSFPEDWKSSAIEYRRLKKLIKDVVAELSGMGLSPDVLHKLLVTEEEVHIQAATRPPATSLSSALGTQPILRRSAKGDTGDVLEFEFESDESPTLSTGPIPAAPTVPIRRVKEVTVDPILDEWDDDDPNEENSGEAQAGPTSVPYQAHHRKFRLRLLSDSSSSMATSAGPVKPVGVMELMRMQSEGRKRRDAGGTSGSEWRHGVNGRRKAKRVVRAGADGNGLKAEYVIVGDATHPTPQLHLQVSTSHRQHSSSGDGSSGDSETDTTEDDDPPSLAAPPNGLDSPDHTPRFSHRQTSLVAPSIDIIPPSPSLKTLRAAASPIWALASGVSVGDGLRDLSLGNDATEKLELDPPPLPTTANGSSPPDREFIVPLASDLAFFNLLTAALTSLSTFHASQQSTFRDSVSTLCRTISQSIRPQSSETYSTYTTAQLPRLGHSSSTASKRDLYVWREIFTLWIEAEIFESSAERTRGERSIEQAEVRLKAFANEVVIRGLGDRRTMKGKKTREAWEDFLRLNVLLLDLKRFQMANINAARKILKKHDKHTALTASAGFPSFIRSTLSAHVDENGNASTWAFYDTSLPHVLLASLTDTLLPILPSLDDYACLICTSIAFKPIRLACSHLFCVRCLVKMQKAGKGECPLCRSQVVLTADRNSLDHAVMRFMKEWFPKEVKMKRKENEIEVAKEQVEESGLDTRCIIA